MKYETDTAGTQADGRGTFFRTLKPNRGYILIAVACMVDVLNTMRLKAFCTQKRSSSLYSIREIPLPGSKQCDSQWAH